MILQLMASRCCRLSRMHSIDDEHYEEQEVLDMPRIRCMVGEDTPMGGKWAEQNSEAEWVIHGPVTRFGRE